MNKYFIIVFIWLITLEYVPKFEAHTMSKIRLINGTRRHGGPNRRQDEQENRTDTNDTNDSNNTDIANMTHKERFGPTWGPSYHPHYGYEPYWALGDWTNKNVTIAPNKSDLAIYIEYNGTGPTPKGYRGTDNCPIPCPDLFTAYGVICARDKDDNLKTFKNYCHMLYDECAGINEGREWVMVYKHACWDNKTQLELYEHAQDTINEQIDEIIKKFLNKNYTTITPEPPKSKGMKDPIRRAQQLEETWTDNNMPVIS